MITLSEPKIIQRGPYAIAGTYATFESDNEGPAWDQAYHAFCRQKESITNRTNSLILGFLYRPHKDDPSVPEQVRSCFIGVEVEDLDHVPEGMVVTRFSGGQYVTMECRSDEPNVGEGVGRAIAELEKWIPEQGYLYGDACLTCSDEKAVTPPYIEYVFIKMDKPHALLD